MITLGDALKELMQKLEKERLEQAQRQQTLF